MGDPEALSELRAYGSAHSLAEAAEALCDATAQLLGAVSVAARDNAIAGNELSLGNRISAMRTEALCLARAIDEATSAARGGAQ